MRGATLVFPYTNVLLFSHISNIKNTRKTLYFNYIEIKAQ